MWSKYLDHTAMSFYSQRMLILHCTNNYNKSVIIGKYRNSKVNFNTSLGINTLFDNYNFIKNKNDNII